MSNPTTIHTRAPTGQQRRAADPKTSVWVSANAGSGKTQVLVERVIRLLLAGAAPDSILCITYTKAAAAEMAGRLFERLGSWAALSDSELAGTLVQLGVDGSDQALMTRARGLFTRALETPGSLKIQTIHAFCERLLHLFPVEAGVSPGFKVTDERESQRLQATTTEQVLDEADGGGSLQLPSNRLSALLNEEQFEFLISKFVNVLKPLDETLIAAGPDAYAALIKFSLGIPLLEATQTVAHKFKVLDREAYLAHAAVLESHKLFHGENISETLRTIATTDDPYDVMFKYFTVEHGKETRKPSRLLSAPAAREHPATAQFLLDQQTWFFDLHTLCCTLQMVDANTDAFAVAQSVLAQIAKTKARSGHLAFSDLISRTARLLSTRRATQWVLYKLDKGLNHILLDEAQDTSPDQWRIIMALAEEFFAGRGAYEESQKPDARSLFVVGDPKQSIFGFQGADADGFLRMQHELIARGTPLMDEALTLSFRSTQTVLDAVDRVFTKPGPDASPHQAARTEIPGIVEFWPLIENNEDADEDDPWTKPVDRPSASSPRRKLAALIAGKIAGWLHPAPRLRMDGKTPLMAGDILILFRSRNPLFQMVLAELYQAGVPVAGADRLRLLQSIAVQDLVILLQWILLPDDDHALAVILKSPLMPEPLDDAGLFNIAHGRKGRLREHLTGQNLEWLTKLQTQATALTPFQLLSLIMNRFRKAIMARLGIEGLEAADAMLDQALEHAQLQGASLFGFLQWFTAEETEQRREMEKDTGAVRLMTVHGAKGLEAPVVILAEATAPMSAARDKPRVITLPPGTRGQGLPFWRTTAPGPMLPALQKWLADDEAGDQAEHERLLYVAMTRAADELYVAGFKPKRGVIAPQSWWAILTQRLSIVDVEEAPAATEIHPSPTPPTRIVAKPDVALPDWLYVNPPVETPRRTFGVLDAMDQSHLYDSRAAKRGRAVHGLLEALGEAPADQREALSLKLAERFGVSAGEAVHLTRGLATPAIQPFLGEGSRGEVDIAGRLEPDIEVHGRLDRLAVREGGIYLLDYKTGRSTSGLVGPGHPYARQMAVYAKLLGEAYPSLPVKSALFWADEARLEILAPAVLALALQQVASHVT